MKTIKHLLILLSLMATSAFAQTEQQYAYDRNGNMTKDLSKGITKIEYNSLNLPRKVIWNDSRYSVYTYDARGNKLRARHVDGDSETTLDYCGNLVYENGELKRILLEDYG